MVDDVDPLLELQPVKFQMKEQKEKDQEACSCAFMNSTFYEQIIKYHISYRIYVYPIPLTAAESFQVAIEV